MVNNLIIGDWEVSRKNETDQNTYSSQSEKDIAMKNRAVFYERK